MTFARVISRIHLWAGVVLGIQVLLWMASGVVMTWFHLDLVRGERAMATAPSPELEARSYASPGGVIAQTDAAFSVELKFFRGRPVYEVDAAGGRALFDAQSGEKLTPIDEPVARDVARSDYVGDGKISRLTLMTDPPHEYRGKRPVWRADFSDRLNTRLYISPDNGAVLARRNDIWRLYDFFWMLHIMDYGERENFNNWFAKFFSAGGLAFAFTGLVMVLMKKGRTQIGRDVNFVVQRLKFNSTDK